MMNLFARPAADATHVPASPAHLKLLFAQDLSVALRSQAATAEYEAKTATSLVARARARRVAALASRLRDEDFEGDNVVALKRPTAPAPFRPDTGMRFAA